VALPSGGKAFDDRLKFEDLTLAVNGIARGEIRPAGTDETYAA
jgi:hypothetical protein